MAEIGLTKALKRMFVIAARRGLSSPNLASVDPVITRAAGNVGVEYPVKQVQYPSIWVTSTFKTVEWQDLAPSYETLEDKGYKRGHFEASINYEVMALSNEERDSLADAMLNMILYGHIESSSNQFRQAMVDEEYLAVAPILAAPRLGPEGMTVGTPWDDSTLCYTRQISFDTYGEFYQRLGQVQLVPLREIDVIVNGDPNAILGPGTAHA